MPTVGSVKAQITKAANALRIFIDAIDESLFISPSNNNTGTDPLEFHKQKTTIATTMYRVQQLLIKLEERWGRAEEYASEQTDSQKEPDILDEFRAHWDTNGCEQLVEKAEELLARLQAALVLHESPIPSNDRPIHVNTNVDMARKESHTPPPERNVTPVPPLQSLQCPRANEYPLANISTFQYGKEAEGPNTHVLAPNASMPIVNGQPVTQSSYESNQYIKLPPFELPDFSGDNQAFPEFWELFATAVHNNTNVPVIKKFLYLKGKLKGEAAKLIAPLNFSEQNYQEAVKILNYTYARPELLRARLYDQIEAIPSANDTPIGQRTTLCTIKALWIQLQKAGEQPASSGLMRIIRRKFPTTTRREAHKLRRITDNWTVNELLTALDQVIDELEVTEDPDTIEPSLQYAFSVQHRRSPSPRPEPQHRSNVRRGSRDRYNNLQRSTDTAQTRCCPFCVRGRHEPEHCTEVPSPRGRRELARRENLCWICLRTGHRSRSCRAAPCSACQRLHHQALCYTFNRTRSPVHSTSSRRDRYYRPRSPQRDSSLESRRPYGGRSRSSSHSDRTPSPQEDYTRNRFRRGRNSPHPRVGFQDQPTSSAKIRSHHYSTSSRETSELSDSESDTNDTLRPNYRINTQVAVTAEPQSKADTSRSPIPRLMIVEAAVYNLNTKADQYVTILLDSGSQHSFISKNVAETLGLQLKHPKDVTTITFGGHEYTEKSYRVTTTLRNPVTGTPVKLKLWTRTRITSIPKQVNTGCTASPKASAEIDILIGMDYYWNVINLSHNKKLPSGLVQSQTKFGPILSGPNTLPFHRVLTTTTEFQNHDKTIDTMVRRLCALDSEDMEQDREINHSEIIQHYYNTVRIIDGSIHVQFPWKVKYPHLPDNKALALRRLESQYEKLHTNTEVWEEYCNIFKQQLQTGIVEEVTHDPSPEIPMYYIPYQAVIKSDSKTTKLRIVFDASSHMKGAPSLNDCIHQGPTMLPDLCGTLLRARLTPILITADVEKAFHQIRLQEDQRDATRFLWLRDPSKPRGDRTFASCDSRVYHSA